MKKLCLLLLTSVLFFIACTSKNLDSSYIESEFRTESNKLENIRTFAKLYGYVRYFHPSDEAIALDWEKFAIYGVDKVKNAQGSLDLISILNELFLPIAPDLKLSANSIIQEPPNTNANSTQNYRVWQHHGLGGQYKGSLYESTLLGEIPEGNANPIWFTSSVQDSNVKKIKIKARAKVNPDDPKYGGGLFLMVLDASGTPIFEDYMRDRLISANEWNTYEITGEFDGDAMYLYFGADLIGSGEMWVDDFELYSSSDGLEWSSIEIANSGFDELDEKGNAKFLTYGENSNFNYSVIQEKTNNVLHINSPNNYKVGEKFEKYPQINEKITKKIGLGITSVVPLTVISEIEKTKNIAFEELNAKLQLIDLETVNVLDENVRLANVLISWNVFQHFFPYFDSIDINWNDVLIDTIEETLSVETHNEFYNVLRKMVAKTRDGHGVVYRKNKPNLASIPFKVEWIEGEIVVIASNSDVFKKGDIVKSIDDISGEESLQELEKYVAGSPQLRRFRALNQFGQGLIDSTANIEILRDGNLVNIDFKRENKPPSFFYNFLAEFNYPESLEIEKDIFYLSPYNTSQEDFDQNIKRLANAKGIIFDNRWLNRNTETTNKNKETIRMNTLLSHLTDKPLTSAKWRVPEITYPDRENLSFSESDWDLQPKTPHFKAKVVVINVPSVVSSGETYMAIGNQYGLIKMVGEATAGTNGNINYINLIGGGRVMYTGMKVTKHDDSQLYLKGYFPDYPVTKTIQAVKDGRDEYLEKALNIVRN